MSLGLSQSLILTQSHSLLLAQKMELSQRLAQRLEGIRRKNPSTDEASTLGKVVAGIIDRICKPNLKQVFTTLLDKPLQDAMVKSIGTFAVPTRVEIRDFSLHHLFTTNTDGQGRFIHVLDEQGHRLAEVPKTDLGNLSQALADPQKFETDIESIRQTLESQVQAGRKEVSFDGLHSMQDALKIAPLFRASLEAFTNALLYLLTVKDEKGRLILKDFALDCVVLEKLDIILSERLQKRFVKRFGRVRAGSDKRHIEECLLNTIAELSLISLGIISPGIFTPRRGEVDMEMLEELDSMIECAGMTLKQVFRYYQLRTEGTFFWNRYHTLNQPPCRVTEDLIRSFITKTVRKDRIAVIAAVNLDEFFEKTVEAAANDDQEDREMALREVLIGFIEDEKFQEQFVDLLKGWYKYLYIFYR